MIGKIIKYDGTEYQYLALVKDQLGDLITINDKYIIDHHLSVNGGNQMINKSQVIGEYDSISDAIGTCTSVSAVPYSLRNVELLSENMNYSWK